MQVPFPTKFGDEERVIALNWRDSPPDWARNGVVSIGNFDGVHLGHVALIKQARQLARQVRGPMTVITFDPHPLQLLGPERFQPPLMTPLDRAGWLRHAGANAIIFLRTDHELLDLTPVEFFDQILVGRFVREGIVEGFNFRFGKHRAGSNETLKEFCDKSGLELRVVDPFELDGTIVSSSVVRKAIECGDIEKAERFLGGSCTVLGRVVEGAKRGRTIGFPTANLGDVQTLLPGNGVYAVRVFFEGSVFAGAANVGPNPTFGESAQKVEVHIIDFQGDLYGKELRVYFKQRLRETRTFGSAADLVNQLNLDVEETKRIVRLPV